MDLFDAIEMNKINKVKRCIEKGHDLNKPDKYNSTPLQIACYLENSFIIRLLMDNGAYDKNSLNMVCYNNDIYSLQVLLEYNPDVRLINEAFFVAKQKGSLECMQLIRANEILNCWSCFDGHFNLYIEWFPKELLEDFIDDFFNSFKKN